MDGAGLGVVGVGFEDFEIMGTGFGGVVELLGIEVAEGKMGAGFVGMRGEEFVEFLDGIGEVAGLLQGDGKAVAGIGGVGPDGERVFEGSQCARQIARFGSGKAQVVMRFEVGGIVLSGGLIGADGFLPAMGFLRFDAVVEKAFGLRVTARARFGR